MKRLLTAIISVAFLSLFAVAPPRGNDRLRELVVFPRMDMTFNFGLLNWNGDKWSITENENLPDEISKLREELKQHPDDIDRLLRLGDSLGSNDQTNESQACFQKVEQICRIKIAANPHDGLSLTKLGKALDALTKNDEAENVYRRATVISPNEWMCWVGLGNYLGDAWVEMFPMHLRRQLLGSRTPPREVLDFRPSPEALKRSETLCSEASRCFDRAMTIAPKEPEVFIQRAAYMSSSNWFSCFVRHIRRSEEIEDNAFFLAHFSPETIANLQKAAELRPKDYQLIGLAAYSQWFNAVLQANVTSNFTFDMLPDKNRQSIRNAMTSLETLSQDSDKTTAAGALRYLGMLNMAFGNKEAATANFRRAVSLNPAHEQTWDLLFGMLLDSGSLNDLLAVGESRLKANNSARNHLVLGKVYAKMGNWKEANNQATIAGKLETNNIIPPLLLAAVALKQSADTNQMTMAFRYLTCAEEILAQMPKNDETQKRWREMLLDSAIAGGLQGSENGQKLARQWLAVVLEYYPDDNDAKEILSALGAN
jgi:tetratricopeptide (TPR) repeat protein